MNTINLLIADPYNDNQIRLFHQFEESNHLDNTITSFLNEIRKLYDKETYEKLQNENNEMHYIFFLKENDCIIDSCYVRGERDRKICELYFVPLNKKNRALLTNVCNYVLGPLGMEQIIVSVNLFDNNMKSELESKGFENIGKVNGKLAFIKEKEDVKEVGRVK